jgi:30S ribosomal protein S31
VGRGDKRTAKGKRFKHSFGNSRPKNVASKKKTKPTPAAAPAAKATKKK